MGERVLVFGDRNWTDGQAIERRLREIHAFTPIEFVIEGEARGADTLAKEAAYRIGIRVEPFPADWARYGRAAGPVRNQQMLDEGVPTRGLCFHSNITKSKGSADMLRRCRKAGLPTEVHS